jgi:hypothetical protein
MDEFDAVIRRAYEQISRQHRASLDAIIRKPELREQMLQSIRPNCPWGDDDILRRAGNLRRKKQLPRSRDL